MTEYLEPKTIEELLTLGPMPMVKNPYDIYKKMRDETPVFDNSKDNIEASVSGNPYSVMITRYDDIKAVLKDDKTFASALNNRTMGLVMGPTVVGMDGKAHMKHRALITPSMTARTLKKDTDFSSLIRSVADSYIDKFIDDGKADLHKQFCYSYPLAVFVTLLGLPDDIDLEEFHDMSKGLCLVASDPEKGINSSVWLENFLLPIVKEKRANPTDDMISVLVQAEVNGEKLSDLEAVSFLRLLTLAGAETTNHLIGTSFVAMLNDPEMAERVRADRSLVPKMLAEAMRWESPVSTIMRESTCDTKIGDIEIKKDTAIVCQIGSANRDERRFPNPNDFDMDREDNDPIPFGYGRHYCAGSHLAQMEAEIGVNALLDRLDNIKAQEGKEFGVIGFSFRGPHAVPVTFDKIG